MNTTISFKANLLQNPEINKAPARSVEDILGNTTAYSEPVRDDLPRKSNFVPKLITGTAAIVLLGLCGRRGMFGKRIQKFLGGRTDKLSREQILANIKAKLSEYSRQRGDTQPFEIKESGNGKTQASRIKSNGNREIITFNTDQPDYRVEFTKTKDKKGKGKEKRALEYTTWKGSDILDKGFDDENFYKKFTRGKVERSHRFGLKYGPKYSQAYITYGKWVKSPDQSMIDIRTSYYNDGNICKIVETNHSTGAVSTKDILYGKDKKEVRGLDLVSGNDGSVIRKIRGRKREEVSMPNRKNSLMQKVREFFSIPKKNVYSD